MPTLDRQASAEPSGDPTWRSWQGEAMQIGVVYPQIELGGDPEAVRRIGRATEDLGFDHLLAYDHVLGAVHDDRDPPLVGPYTERDPFHDPLVMFAHLAAMTERIGFVTGVVILPQRQTALVARQAADVDLLSGGRLRLGVGIGWNYVEYDALGQDFRTRGAREEEQIALLRRLWTEPVVDFTGRFDRVDRATIAPKPTRPIPIWLGGYGDAAYQRAARIGDGFIFGGRTENVIGAWDRIRDRVVEAGRPVESFGGECVVMSRQGPEAVAAKIAAWGDAGGTHATVLTMGLGIGSADGHIEYLAAVADVLGLEPADR
jgi:probable F420-dependent oxidoreductase